METPEAASMRHRAEARALDPRVERSIYLENIGGEDAAYWLVRAWQLAEARARAGDTR